MASEFTKFKGRPWNSGQTRDEWTRELFEEAIQDSGVLEHPPGTTEATVIRIFLAVLDITGDLLVPYGWTNHLCELLQDMGIKTTPGQLRWYLTSLKRFPELFQRRVSFLTDERLLEIEQLDHNRVLLSVPA